MKHEDTFCNRSDSIITTVPVSTEHFSHFTVELETDCSTALTSGKGWHACMHVEVHCDTKAFFVSTSKPDGRNRRQVTEIETAHDPETHNQCASVTVC